VPVENFVRVFGWQAKAGRLNCEPLAASVRLFPVRHSPESRLTIPQLRDRRSQALKNKRRKAIEMRYTGNLAYFSGGSAGEVNVELEDEDDGEEAGVVEGIGAPFPAVLEPNPSLLSDTASIFPVGLIPFLS
jgi:hypothetical protein